MEEEKLMIGLAGDVMIGRSVDQVISKEGWLYVWGDVLPLLRHSDINIVNLETTLTREGKKVSKVFNFKAAPEKVKTLTEANITFVNLANNHILDYAEEGLKETIKVLQEAGIRFAGAGLNKEQAERPCLLEKRDFRVGLIGITDNEPGWCAGENKSGVNYINIAVAKERQKALDSIAQLERKSDIVVVSIHWGPNMREEPSDEFVAFAHAMIDHGADIIHGHSAHIFQGVEVYNNKLVLYDTGDFVDDYVVDAELKNNHSFLFQIEVTKAGIERLQLIPIVISNYQVNLATGKSFEWSIKRIQRLSGLFGTRISDSGELALEKNKKTLSGF